MAVSGAAPAPAGLVSGLTMFINRVLIRNFPATTRTMVGRMRRQRVVHGGSIHGRLDLLRSWGGNTLVMVPGGVVVVWWCCGVVVWWCGGVVVWWCGGVV